MDYKMDVQMALFAEGDQPVVTLDCPALAMGYVPMQQWQQPFTDLSKAMCHGSIFPALIKPFMGGACCV